MHLSGSLTRLGCSSVTRGAALALAGVLLVACDDAATSSSTAADAATDAAAAPAAAASAAPTPPTEAPVAVPVDRAEVEKVVNPTGKKPYEGKTGTLSGRITLKGDDPPATTHRYGRECASAEAKYGKVFAVGAERELPDVLVAVTGYDGFVPEPEPAETVTLERCTFDASTVAMTFGQRLEVKNVDDKLSYMPYLDGAPFRAVMVAIPKGDPVKLYPQREGRYLLRDQMKRPYLVSNVFVLKFPTHDVTGADGRYEIRGIPVGKVKVNALIPSVRKTADGEIEIKEGDNKLDLVIEYDAEKDKPSPVPEPVWGDRELPR